MTEYLTEQEQVELLKNWIKQYILVILTGVFFAILAIFGWRFWQERQAKIEAHASSVYDEMLATRARNDKEATLIQAKKLFTHYEGTTYSNMAALMLARSAAASGDLNEAQKQLQWVMDNSHIASFKQIARLRLARLLIANNKSDEALKILGSVDDEAFNGLTEEVKGDAYLSKKETAKAAASYQKAIEELPNADVIRPLLRMKLENLATTTTQPKSKS